MTTTYLVSRETAHGPYTDQVEAHTEAEALAIARQYLGAHDWQIVGTVEPAQHPPYIYHPDLIGQRDPLEGED